MQTHTRIGAPVRVSCFSQPPTVRIVPLLIATRNRHKVLEIEAILGPDFACRSLADVPAAPELREDATTFEGNAEAKVRQLADWFDGPGATAAAPPGSIDFLVADDSGLEVDALGGAPGVLSARFAADERVGSNDSQDRLNNAKLLRLLEGLPAERRTARFRCVLALLPVGRQPPRRTQQAASQVEFFHGICAGTITFAPRGPGGFGYDPLFVPVGEARTFAELGEETKNRISHRARALAALAARLRSTTSEAEGAAAAW